MTDLNVASTSDPKVILLKDLLDEPFWEHLTDGEQWKSHIRDTINLSTTEQLELDNLALRDELTIAHRALSLSAQEIKITRMENFIERQRTAINNAKINMDKAFGDLGSMTGWGY